MLRVAQVIDTLRTGGAERLIVTFTEGIQDRDDIRTTVIMLKDHQTQFRTEIEALGIEVIAFPGKSLVDRNRFKKLRQYIEEQKFDVIHTHLSYANILGPMIGRSLDIPVVTTLHNTKIGSEHLIPVRQIIEVLALRYGGRHYIAVGQAVKDNLKRFLPANRITVIPNAVATPPAISKEEITQIRKTFSEDEQTPLVLAVGRLSAQKGFTDLIEAFSMVHETHPTAQLLIAGTGGLESEIVAKINEVDGNSYVKLLGNRDDVQALMAATDLFVNSSHWEGLPVTLLEAMAARAAIIATTVGEIPKVLIDGTGILIPPKKPQVIAENIQQLLDDPEKRLKLGENAYTHVIANFGAQKWIDDILKVYTQTMS